LRPRNRRLAVALLGLSLTGCERDEIVSVDPDQAPGQSAPTVEATIAAAAAPSWVDTVFGGFARPSAAPFMLLEAGTPELASRGLVRFAIIVDSVTLPDTVSAIRSFDEGRVIIRTDTTRSQLAGAGTTLQLRLVEQSWDARSASWDNAVDSLGITEPWSAGPGGTLGAVLSETTLTELPDSIVLSLGEGSDSLISLWADTGRVNNGLALVVADSGSIVVGSGAVLRYDAVPDVVPDTTISLSVFASAASFIFDRSSPTMVAGVLRTGGVEGWRSFIEIALPDSVAELSSGQRRSLRGSTVNRAELILISLPPLPRPFAAATPFEVAAFELADDFGTFGPKTPLGPIITGSTFVLQPDSLQAGETVAIDITDRVQAFADVPADSTPPSLRLLLRARLEARTFGFWEFGAADGDPAFAPSLRIVFTPPVEFSLP